MKPRPVLLYCLWIAMFSIHTVVPALFTIVVPVIAYAIYYITSALCNAVVLWFAMLEPHRRLSVVVPLFSFFLPGLLMRATSWDFYGVSMLEQTVIEVLQIGSGTIALYLMSKYARLRLIRANESPQVQPIDIRVILISTTVLALSLSVVQFLPMEEVSPPFGGIQNRFFLGVILLFAPIGAANTMAYCWMWAQPSQRALLAIVAATALHFASLWGYWIFIESSSGGQARVPDLLSQLSVLAGSAVGEIVSIAAISVCGYKLLFISARKDELAFEQAETSAEFEADPFAAE